MTDETKRSAGLPETADEAAKAEERTEATETTEVSETIETTEAIETTETENTEPETTENTEATEPENTETESVKSENTEPKSAEAENPETAEISETTESTEAENAGPAAPPKREGGNLPAILLGLIVFAAILAYCWMLPAGGGTRDTGVLYAKENGLYLYDLEHEPYLLTDTLSDGGSYHYYYTAWGASCAEEGDWVYYGAAIDDTGAFDLYRRATDVTDAEPLRIASGVYDYMMSKDGEAVAYLCMNGDSLELHTFDGETDRTWADGLELQNGLYSLSGDGAYLVFLDAYGMLCAAEIADEGQPMKLTDAPAMYTLAEETGDLYFVAEGVTGYAIYRYGFDGADATLVAENVTYMEVMPNGRDVLYATQSAQTILYSDIVTDDMAEADAAAADPEEKAARDEIRAAMEAGEGIDSILQAYYIWTDGEAVPIADDVISAVSMAQEQPYVVGYRAAEIEPTPLSEIDGGLDAVEYAYYMALAYGEQRVFLANADGYYAELSGTDIQPDSLQLSADGSMAAYLAADTTTGETLLLRAPLSDMTAAEQVASGVSDFAFLGEGDALGYTYAYSNGTETAALLDGTTQVSADQAIGVQFAADETTLYFIQEPDAQTGNGSLMQIVDGAVQQLDADVFAFQYKGNGKVVYLQNYDLETGVGDLYYFDGTETRLLDTGVTAIFMY